MKNFKTFLIFIVILNVSALILAGCGDSGDNDTTRTTVSGVASKGLIKGGIVEVFAVDSSGNKISPPLGATTTDQNGVYSVPLGSYMGNVLIEVSGGTYTDEATGDPNQPNATLRAALNGVSGDVSIAVTPMTEVAVLSALSAGSLTSANIARANSTVSSMVGINIINTLPADVISTGGNSTPTTDQLTYGLMLATLSQMVANGHASDIQQAIQNITDDLDDMKIDSTGSDLTTALADFLANDNNKSGIDNLTQTNLDSTIADNTNVAIILPEDMSDMNKGKAMVVDLRNTVLSVYNYQGYGVAGIVETPFKELSEELQNEIGPELTTTVDKVAWVIKSLGEMEDTNCISIDEYPDTNLKICINNAKTEASFVITKGVEETDSGSLTIDDPNLPTSGIFHAELETTSGGTATADLTYSATVSNDMYTSMTFTGLITDPGYFTIDFKQSGRKLSATFAEYPAGAESPAGLDGSALDHIYPTSIYLEGRVTTTTTRMDGLLNISSIVWAGNGDDVYYGEPRPKTAIFAGAFEELKAGISSGVKFSGTITGNWSNAATYNSYEDTTADNFPQWVASFDGKIEAPSMPTLSVFLTASQSEYQKGAMEVNFRKISNGASTTLLSGIGTYDETSDYVLITITLTNQNGMIINLTIDESKSSDEQFSGNIKTSGGIKIADIYTVNEIPMIKYIDGYFESII